MRVPCRELTVVRTNRRGRTPCKPAFIRRATRLQLTSILCSCDAAPSFRTNRVAIKCPDVHALARVLLRHTLKIVDERLLPVCYVSAT